MGNSCSSYKTLSEVWLLYVEVKLQEESYG